MRLRNLPADLHLKQWLAFKPPIQAGFVFFLNLGQKKDHREQDIYVMQKTCIFLVKRQTTNTELIIINLFNTLAFPELLGKYYCTFSPIVGFETSP